MEAYDKTSDLTAQVCETIFWSKRQWINKKSAAGDRLGNEALNE